MKKATERKTALFLAMMTALSSFSSFVLNIHAEEEVSEETPVIEEAETETISGFFCDEEGKVYYLDPETQSFAYGLCLIDEDMYYFDEETGEMAKGFLELEEEETSLYFDEETGQMKTGWQTIEEETYYFDPDSGAMKKGFFYDEESQSSYYFDEETGIRKTGLVEVKGNTYYFSHETGAMIFGFAEPEELEGTIYLDPDSGILLKGQQYIDGEWYNFNENTGVMETGFVYIPAEKKTVYYEPEEGAMATGETVIGDKTYYLNQETGEIASGITKEKDHTWFIDETTGKKLTGQIYEKGAWYYFDENTGDMVTGFKYIPSLKKTVYYDPASGKMVYGDVKIDGQTYHFNTVTGAMMDGSFQTLVTGGKVDQVFVQNGRVVLHNFRYEQTYYQVDRKTGIIIHSQKLFNDKIWMEGIDISSHNGTLDLTEYQNGFVIIRAAWGTNEDTLAYRNMDLCEKLKIPYGVYVYSYAVNEEQLDSEADFVLDMVKGRKIPLGIWYDIEYDYYKASRMENWPNRTVISKYCKMFCDKIAAAGYRTGVYSSSYWFDNYITMSGNYEKWIANWGEDDGTWRVDLSGQCAIHQYTSQPLDKNVFYIDPSFWY